MSATWWRRTPRRAGPMRVMFVVPDLGLGGAERHVVTLAPALDPDAFRVSIVCVGDEGELFDELRDTGVPAHALHSRTRPVRALVALVRAMREERPDIVVTRGYNAEALGRIAAALTRVPRSVVWVHNATDIGPRGRIRPVVDRLLEPLTSAYYGVAHAQRTYLVDELGHPAEKVEIIHNGVDPARFAPGAPVDLGLPAGARAIGIVAVLREEKDHPTLLRAMRMVVDEVPEAHLLVIGDGPLRPELEELARQLGMSGNVTFAGSRPDVAALLPALDVAVLSSTTECFPMAVLEAMACGVPVVGTEVGGVPEMIEDGVTGYLVPSRHPRATADALVKILRDPARAAEMGRAARDRVLAEFTLDRSVRRAGATLARTAGRKPARLAVVLDQTAVGGAERLLLDLCRRFDRSVVEPRLVCLRAEGPLGDAFREVVPVEVLDRTGRFDMRTLPRLVRSLRAAHTDVVLVAHHNRAALALGRVAARLAGAAHVVAAHDMDLTRVGGRVLPRHVVETLFLSEALVLLAPSQGRYLHEEEGVGRFPWRRAPEVVIPNGIVVGPRPGPADRAEARRRLGLDDADLVIGIAARLSKQKAHHILLRATARLAVDRARLRLVVIGGGVEEPALRALVAELGIADHVLFTGVRDDVRELLPGCDVTCLSSVHEGAPLVVLESMAACVPVVATDCGAVRDLVADGREGYVVPVGDASALADRLGILLDDPRMRAEMGERARQRAEAEYSIEHTAARFQELITRLAVR
ncbi:glycosyltransferase [Pseudonocardia cypriaca]|uniref:Glycosyltransferase involved in cell wall biosynthesis n=1 Tax=Pseudonocardia cypriaca TaxID=882449 RepID=A0A543GAQ7_9PSEU|nr:glycosyltransferase [Pseudonocardia cypriaca]TQM43084.1 glycosyltransferase involved in cell wall biosynthesis [Pseudonocardia cypriaca]